jgi:hypothetical protein
VINVKNANTQLNTTKTNIKEEVEWKREIPRKIPVNANNKSAHGQTSYVE